jgi:molybdopterin molybdotransferase
MAQLSDNCFAAGDQLMTLAEALALLDQRIVPVTGVEEVGLRRASRRTLATDVVAERDVPPHDNSAVDGYAVRFADLADKGEIQLDVVGRAAAGHPVAGVLRPGQAIRIFTGATMPAGSDTVAMQEDCREAGTSIFVPAGLRRGDNRRLASEDIRAGTVVLRRGRRLRPQDIGLAASLGRTALSVHTRLRVAIFSTGDEVAEPGTALGPGSVYDANRYVLDGLLQDLGCVVDDLGILPDRPAAVRAALHAAAAAHDLIITSGGVSAGEEDHVARAVEVMGRLTFWRLAVKPGRPVAFGQIGAVPFVGLPGNPVAAMVTFLRIARPLILRLSGAKNTAPLLFRVRAGFDHCKKRDRREWLRARLAVAADGALVADKFEREGSGILSSMVDSDGLVELSEELTQVEAGTLVDFLPFSEVT